MTTISIAIQKGGSGKTTTAMNLAAELSRQEQRVLLVDMDPQANLTQSMGFVDDPEPNINYLLRHLAQGQDITIQHALYQAHGMDLVPASLDLASAELELISVYGRERLLEQLLVPARDQYDFILLDCPPSLGILTVNALTASDYVLMPLQAEYLPLKGLLSFNKALKMIKKQLNPRIEVLGYLLTKFDTRKRMNRQVSEQLQQLYGKDLFETRIRSNIALAQAQEKGKDIFTYQRGSHGAQDYRQLALEVLTRLKK